MTAPWIAEQPLHYRASDFHTMVVDGCLITREIVGAPASTHCRFVVGQPHQCPRHECVWIRWPDQI